ncbi:hypothetical protein Tco_0007304 [Tanacetum coccineum]
MAIIDPVAQVVLGRPFVEISNMTIEPPEGVVRFTNGTDEISYKMPHKIEQSNSLSDLEKEHTKFVYLRNEEDKRRGVEYVMSKILGFYKECLELGPKYANGMDDEGEFMIFSTWMTFGGNTRDLGSFGEETDEITDLHHINEEILFSEHGDGVTCIKQRRRNQSSDGVRDLVMALGHGPLIRRSVLISSA